MTEFLQRVLLKTYKDEKYGYIAHFISEDNESIFARIIMKDDLTIYEDFDEEINKELEKKYFTFGDDINEFIG